VGVQTAALASMKASLEAGHVVELPAGATIADGIAVRRPGELTYAMVRKYVDEVVTVDEEEIANAILVMLEQEKSPHVRTAQRRRQSALAPRHRTGTCCSLVPSTSRDCRRSDRRGTGVELWKTPWTL
jgi:hypothetical protein